VSAVAAPLEQAVRQAQTEPLRVLFVHSGNIFGGVEGLLLAVARHRAAAAGFDPEFAITFGGRFQQELHASGAVAHNVGAVRIRRPDLVWRARNRLGRIARDRGVDVAVTQSSWSHAIFAGPLEAADVPVVRWMHGLPHRHWLERFAARHPPALFIANSRFMASAVEHALPGPPVRVCYGPVTVEGPVEDRLGMRRQLRESIGTAEAAVVIAQVGRLEAGKGYGEHLEALARLPATVKWECWIVGAPQDAWQERYRTALDEQGRRLGLGSRVRWLGTRQDVPAVLAAADIYCQPNTHPETFGVTFIEAMAAGLPVVTSAIGGGVELVDDSCGCLVAPGDVDQLASVLSRLAADPAERTRLGAAGPVRARQLTDPAVQIPALAGLLRGVARVSKRAS
jgi:glycosyltransferase involved in cell wall biosynthesis